VVIAPSVEAFKIARGSMEHTLFEGDFADQQAGRGGHPGSGQLPALHPHQAT
jgi:hypothetical protein